MNLFFVYADGSLVTPELNDSILAGVTRASIIELADDLGHKVDERRISVDEWRAGVASGEISEVFACGTAAVVTPVGRAQVAGRRGPDRRSRPARSRWSCATGCSTSSTAGRPTRTAGCIGSASRPMSSPAAESTRTVGPYRLIGQIGEGGMGVVYLAQAPDDRRVAIKVLRPYGRRRRQRPGPAGARGDVAAAGAVAAHRGGLRRRPVGRDAVRRHALCPRAVAARGRRPPRPARPARAAAARPRARRGARRRPSRRRPAPRRQALERADRGRRTGAHRLRAGPAVGRHGLDPDRLAARHARLPRARDPVRRRRRHPPQTCTPGRPPWSSPPPAAGRTAPGRRWRSWTGPGEASPTWPASRRLVDVLAAALRPDPGNRPTAQPARRVARLPDGPTARTGRRTATRRTATRRSAARRDPDDEGPGRTLPLDDAPARRSAPRSADGRTTAPPASRHGAGPSPSRRPRGRGPEPGPATRTRRDPGATSGRSRTWGAIGGLPSGSRCCWSSRPARSLHPLSPGAGFWPPGGRCARSGSEP